MADAPRSKAASGGASSSKSTGIPIRKVRSNQQHAVVVSKAGTANRPRPPPPVPPLPQTAETTATILPKIERRGGEPNSNSTEIANGSSLAMAISPQAREIPPHRRPSCGSSKPASSFVESETSPTTRSDSREGPLAKAAWCTPRSPLRSHLESFFAHSSREELDHTACANEDGGGEEAAKDSKDRTLTATPARLKSVEAHLRATDELYRVDLDALVAENDKFFEISTTATQHVESIQEELPQIATAYEETTYVLPRSSPKHRGVCVWGLTRSGTNPRRLILLYFNLHFASPSRSALHDLSKDIATLHEQQEFIKDKMCALSTGLSAIRFPISLSRLLTLLCLSLLLRLMQLDQVFNQSTEEKVALLEAHAADKTELQHAHEQEIQELDAQFRSQVHELERKYNAMEATRLEEMQQLQTTSAAQLAELVEASQREKAALRADKQTELDELRRAATAEYEALRSKSEADFSELVQTSNAQYDELQISSSEEIRALKEASASQFAEATEQLTRELDELRHSRQEELARLNMAMQDQFTRMDNQRVQETTALQRELDAVKDKLALEIRGLTEQHARESRAMQVDLEQTVRSLKSERDAQIHELESKTALELTLASKAQDVERLRLHESSTRTQTTLVDRYETELTALRDESKRENDRLTLTYETELDSLKRSSTEQLERALAAHESTTKQLRDAHSAKVLLLEAALRDHEKRSVETAQINDAEVARQSALVDASHAQLEALAARYERSVDGAKQVVARKDMELCERDARMLSVQQELASKLVALETTRKELKAVVEDRQVKANTILELTFVIKSRDEEVERLRNALLDSTNHVNQKTEILELTAESLSTKARELEATQAALRKESGRLSKVEECMHHKEEILEDTEMKVESMRLNMETLRLEMKRMQMDMKLQLEHTEAEMELKNGEISRLHAMQSELKQKHDFYQQTIARLEASLAATQRQVDESQRRVTLLKLEATQNADDATKTNDLLLEKEQEVLVLTKEKHAVVHDKQRVQIQLNNATQVVQSLHEKLERQRMHGEDLHVRFLRVVSETSAEKDKRARVEKQLLLLELAATKERARHFESVDARCLEHRQENEAQGKADSDRLETQLHDLETTATQLEAMETLYERAKHDIQELQSTVEEKKHALACTHDKMRFEDEVAQGNIAALTARLEELTLQTTQLTTTQEALQRELAEHCAQKQGLQQEIAELRAQNEELAHALSGEKLGLVHVDDPQARSHASMEVVAQQAAFDSETLQITNVESVELPRVVDTSDRFIADCRAALGLNAQRANASSLSASTDEILQSIQELMKMLDHFASFQPLHVSGSPAGGSVESIQSNVSTVLAFLEELHLMTDFAQDILDEECDATASTGSQSNTSSSESLPAFRALARTPTPTTLGIDQNEEENLQIDVPFPLDELEQQQQDMGRASDDMTDGGFPAEVEFPGADFAGVSAGAPSSPLAESLMDISLVMNDHHRIISEAAHWVKETAKLRRQRSSGRSQTTRHHPMDLGTEICRLVREHCAMLSLAKKLFQLKDPRHDLSSLLESLAILKRLTTRLPVFQSESLHGNIQQSDSRESLGGTTPSFSSVAAPLSHSCSQNSLQTSPSIFAYIEDLARHLQDYDFFLQQMRANSEKQWLTATNHIEVLTRQLTDRLELLAKTQNTLGLQNPIVELPWVVERMQALVSSCERLKPWKHESEELRQEAPHDDNGGEREATSDFVDAQQLKRTSGDVPLGVDSYAAAFDRIESDLTKYKTLMDWLRQVLPISQSVESVEDQRARIQAILAQLELFANENAHSGNRDLEVALVEQSQRACERLDMVSLAEANAGGTVSLDRIPVDEEFVDEISRLRALQQQVEREIEAERRTLQQYGLLEKNEDASLATTTAAAASITLSTRLALYEKLAKLQQQIRVDKAAVATEKSFLAANSLQLDATAPTTSRMDVYKTLLDGQNALIEEKMEREVELGKENAFLEHHGLLAYGSRLAMLEELVKLRRQLQDRDELDAMERAFLKENGLWTPEATGDEHQMDARGQFDMRFRAFTELVASRFVQQQEKRERQAAIEAEKEYLKQQQYPGLGQLDLEAPGFSRLRVYEALLGTQRDAKAAWGTDQPEAVERFPESEQQFLDENGLAGLVASLKEEETSTASTTRRRIYKELFDRMHARDAHIQALTAQRERCEAALMAWNEVPRVGMNHYERLVLANQELDRQLTERDVFLKDVSDRFDQERNATLESHALTVAQLERSHDDHLSSLLASSKQELAAALETQAKRLEFVALVRAEEEEVCQNRSGGDDSKQAPSAAMSATRTRALLLEKVTKRDTAAISMIYRSIRLATDILNTSAFAGSASTSDGGGLHGGDSATNASDIPAEVTQAVLNCVKELKALKEFLIESLEQLTRGDNDDVFPSHLPPSFVKASIAAEIASGDKEAAIDFAVCSHREFMNVAHLQLLERQENMNATLLKLLQSLRDVAGGGGEEDGSSAFTISQQKLMQLEMDVTRESETRQNLDCKFHLNEAFYHRLLDERKQVEVALTNALSDLRDECNSLRTKVDILERERYAPLSPVPSSSGSSLYGLVSSSPSPRATPMTPLANSSSAGFGHPGGSVTPMRPEKPRDPQKLKGAGGGTVHKERFVSDLEKETGQRRSANSTTRRTNDWRQQQDLSLSSSSQLEKEFRAMEAATTSPAYSGGASGTGKTSPTSLKGGGIDATADGTRIAAGLHHDQELWYQGVRSVHHIAFFVSLVRVPKQNLFRVEVFNSDTEQQQQTIYVTCSEMQTFVSESKKALKLGITSLDDASKRVEITDVLFERVRVYGEGSSNMLLGFE